MTFRKSFFHRTIAAENVHIKFVYQIFQHFKNDMRITFFMFRRKGKTSPCHTLQRGRNLAAQCEPEFRKIVASREPEFRRTAAHREDQRFCSALWARFKDYTEARVHSSWTTVWVRDRNSEIDEIWPKVVNVLTFLTPDLVSPCTASNRPFLSKETSTAYATHRKRE
jgi:hypothetical protein